MRLTLLPILPEPEDEPDEAPSRVTTLTPNQQMIKNIPIVFFNKITWNWTVKYSLTLLLPVTLICLNVSTVYNDMLVAKRLKHKS